MSVAHVSTPSRLSREGSERGKARHKARVVKTNSSERGNGGHGSGKVPRCRCMQWQQKCGEEASFPAAAKEQARAQKMRTSRLAFCRADVRMGRTGAVPCSQLHGMERKCWVDPSSRESVPRQLTVLLNLECVNADSAKGALSGTPSPS